MSGYLADWLQGVGCDRTLDCPGTDHRLDCLRFRREPAASRRVNIGQVNEALVALYRPGEMGGVGNAITVVTTLAEAARVYVRDWITCPTCGGTTAVYNVDGKAQHHTSDDSPLVCPDCVDGMIPSPQLVERLKVVAGREMNRLVSELRHEWRPLFGSDVEPIVRAVLLASRREEP